MPQKEKFLADIASDNPDTRFAAWRSAGEMEPDVIPELSKLTASTNPGVAKAAAEALTTMTHMSPKRAAVAQQLVSLRTALSYRLLSLIAGEDLAPAIARNIHDPALREEVVFCIERIPGSASNKALITAYAAAKEDFKPRILAALGHRRAEEGLPLCLEAMRSSNQEIALAGAKAFARIGKKPAVGPKIEDIDSLLRYADAQAKQGNTAEAFKIYKSALDRPEEHVQCAAVIGISKLGTPEAAAAIFPKLKSSEPKVRITAANAWKGMAS